jgi:hypothetical protein
VGRRGYRGCDPGRQYLWRIPGRKDNVCLPSDFRHHKRLKRSNFCGGFGSGNPFSALLFLLKISRQVFFRTTRNIFDRSTDNNDEKETKSLDRNQSLNDDTKD